MTSLRLGVGYYVACEGRSPLMAWALALLDEAVQASCRLACFTLGHAWVSAGWAGTESGGDGAQCTRCGESWEVIFY